MYSCAHAQRFPPLYEVWGVPQRAGGGGGGGGWERAYLPRSDSYRHNIYHCHTLSARTMPGPYTHLTLLVSPAHTPLDPALKSVTFEVLLCVYLGQIWHRHNYKGFRLFHAIHNGISCLLIAIGLYHMSRTRLCSDVIAISRILAYTGLLTWII